MNRWSVEPGITLLTQRRTMALGAGLAVLALCAPSETGSFDRNLQAGKAAIGRHLFQEAEWSLRAALSEADGFSENDPRRREVMEGLVEVYRIEGKYHDALPLLETLVSFDERTSGKDTFRLADTLDGQGQVLLAAGEAQRAEVSFRRSLAIRETLLERGSPALIEPLHNVILALQAEAKFADAEPLAELAIRIRSASQGPQAPEVAAEFSLLARLYAASGKFAEAAPPLESALAIQEKVYGFADARLLPALDDLAVAYRKLQRLRDAEPLLTRTLAIREAAAGPMHSDVAQALDNLASLYFEMKRFHDAEPLYRRSLVIWIQVLGPRHPMLATSFDNLAVVCASLGKLTEVEALYRKALAIRDGEDVRSLRNLALVDVALGKLNAAEPLLKRALVILDTQEPSNRGALAATLNDYANVLEKTGRKAKAAPLRRRAKRLESTASETGRAQK